MTTDQQLFEKTKRKDECWHEYTLDKSSVDCVCGYPEASCSHFQDNPDFTTPEGFFWLWERMSEKREWPDFWEFIYGKADEAYLVKTKKEMHPSTFWQSYLVGIFIPERCLINPLKLRAALMEFWEIKEAL